MGLKDRGSVFMEKGKEDVFMEKGKKSEKKCQRAAKTIESV